jgi:hypothetical protein
LTCSTSSGAPCPPPARGVDTPSCRSDPSLDRAGESSALLIDPKSHAIPPSSRRTRPVGQGVVRWTREIRLAPSAGFSAAIVHGGAVERTMATRQTFAVGAWSAGDGTCGGSTSGCLRGGGRWRAEGPRPFCNGDEGAVDRGPDSPGTTRWPRVSPGRGALRYGSLGQVLHSSQQTMGGLVVQTIT